MEGALTLRGRTETGYQEKQHHKVKRHNDKNSNTNPEGGKDLITSRQQAQTLVQDTGKSLTGTKIKIKKAEEIIGAEVSTQ